MPTIQFFIVPLHISEDNITGTLQRCLPKVCKTERFDEIKSGLCSNLYSLNITVNPLDVVTIVILSGRLSLELTVPTSNGPII